MSSMRRRSLAVMTFMHRRQVYFPQHALPPHTISMVHTRHCVQCYRRCWLRVYRHRLSATQRRRFVIEGAPFHRVCWAVYEKREHSSGH